jgi:hypothetical protein
METIKISTDNFDQENTFEIEFVTPRRTRRMKVSLHRDYKVAGDGILWAMQSGSCLKAQYSDKDIAERDRLNAATPVRHGDIVQIEGKQYRTRVLGDYSDCAIFDTI